MSKTPIKASSHGVKAASAHSVIVEYDGRRQTFPLYEGENIVGRPQDNGEMPEVPLADPRKYVSRKHAIITIHGTKGTLRDMGSENGTRLNGVLLRDRTPHPLNDGDVVEIEHRKLILCITSSS